MAQPHRPIVPSDPSSQSPKSSYPSQSYPPSGYGPGDLPGSSTGVTEGLPGTVTATAPQVPHGGAGYAPQVDAWQGQGRDGRRGRGGLDRRRWLALTACALLGSALGAGAERLSLGGPATGGAQTAAPSPSATAPVPTTITPIAATGSSFTSRDGAWRSQRYRDAAFGKLKKGIGLRLDLGTARSLTAVTFTAGTGPMTVELRAGDTAATDGAAYQLVGAAVQADGATTLPAAAGGSHRYWVIWVTQLPPGFQAEVSDPVARG